MSEITNKIRELMAKENMNMTDLAKKSGLNRSTISRYLSGKVEPKTEALSALAQAFHVDVVWLAGFAEPAVPDYLAKYQNSEPILIEQYQILTDENKKQLENYMSFLLSQQDKHSEDEDDQS